MSVCGPGLRLKNWPHWRGRAKTSLAGVGGTCQWWVRVWGSKGVGEVMEGPVDLAPQPQRAVGVRAGGPLGLDTVGEGEAVAGTPVTRDPKCNPKRVVWARA